MTVSEMIDKLSKCNFTAEVLVFANIPLISSEVFLEISCITFDCEGVQIRTEEYKRYYDNDGN